MMCSGRVAAATATFYLLLSLTGLCIAAPTNNSISIKDAVSRIGPTDNSILDAVSKNTPFDDDPVCVWSGKYQPSTYMDCYSNWPGGNYIQYTIRLTGTGMDSKRWAPTILFAIWRNCQGPNLGPIRNNVNSQFARTTALDGDKGWSQVTLQGVDLTFNLNWPWYTDDDNHKCIAQGVRDATCGQIEISNGAHCVNLGYSSADVLEYWDTPGPNHT